MKRRYTSLLAGVLVPLLAAVTTQAAVPAQLQIYFIDVEGGQATLVVTPQRETLLIDAGYAGEGSFTSQPGDPAKARDVDGWQLHVSDEAGEHNAPFERIANLDDASAHWLKVTAKADGSFAVLNGRTGAAKEYGVR